MARSSFIVVSFFSSEEYYRRAAALLREDCRNLDIDHEFVEVERGPTETWADMCRRKVSFYLHMHRKHRRPILWLDADTRLAGKPDLLEGATCDLAGFLRGTAYLRDFDPLTSPRFFAPFALFFNATPAAGQFLELMSAIEAACSGPATDDFFLQEAWLQHEHQLSVMVMPPQLVGDDWPARQPQIFRIGRSGNVSAFRRYTKQHGSRVALSARRQSALTEEANIALQEGAIEDAMVLLRRALLAGKPDEMLAAKVARALRRQGRMAEAHSFLRAYQTGSNKTDLERRFLFDTFCESGRADEASRIGAELLESGSLGDKKWALMRLLRLELDERAKACGIAADARQPMEWHNEGYLSTFDDIVGFYIVEKLTNAPPRIVTKGGILAGPPNLTRTKPGTLVWGGGIRSLDEQINLGAEFRAVRGPLTAERVRYCTGKRPLAVGEPVALLPRLYESPAGPSQRFALGLIATADRDYRCKDLEHIPIHCGTLNAVERLIDQITECQAVLAPSIPTLIACHAYGTPARLYCWADAHEHEIASCAVQLRDYAEAVGFSQKEPALLDRADDASIARAVQHCRLPDRGYDLRTLSEVAPLTLEALPL